MDALYMIGVIAFVVLTVMLLTGAWQDYQEELNKHRAILSNSGDIADLHGVSGVESSHWEKEVDVILARELVSSRL